MLISLGLLGGAKMLNVAVPFLFKGAIDTLNLLQMGTPVETTATLITSMLIGCESLNHYHNIFIFITLKLHHLFAQMASLVPALLALTSCEMPSLLASHRTQFERSQ